VPAVDVPVLLAVVVAVVMFWLPPVLSCCCANAAGLIDATNATVHSRSVSPTGNIKKGFLSFINVASTTSLLGVVCSTYE
jgi:hypothetical protein